MDKLRELNITLPKRSLNNFSYRNQSIVPPPSKFKILIILAMIGAISSLTMLTIYAYKQMRVVEDISLLPIITNDNSPLRTQPEQPGGLIISNQNKAVYHQLKKPLPYDQQKIAQSQQPKVQQVINRYFPIQQSKEQEEPTSANPIYNEKEPLAESSMPSIPPVKSTIFDLMNKEKETVKPQTGLVKVGIAVLKTHASADQEWGRLSKRFKELKNKKHRITEKVAKNGNKMFYLWIVGLKEEAANSLCEHLKVGKQGCFIIHE